MVLRWLQSDSAWDLGLKALSHIPNPTAGAKLLKATKSKNPRLAERAGSFLELRNELRARALLK
jgi:hypothetical protein